MTNAVARSTAATASHSLRVSCHHLRCSGTPACWHSGARGAPRPRSRRRAAWVPHSPVVIAPRQVTPRVGAGRPDQPLAVRLWAHAIGLLLLLGAIAVYVGTESAFVTDESFVVIQLDVIAETGDWHLDHPLPEVDPEGAAFPLHGASRYEDGYVLYEKHPLLVFLYRPVHGLFGISGLVGLSVLGTAGAALVAGLLAEHLRRGTGALALWIVGAASPLFFDSFVVHAHSIAAVGAAGATYLVLRSMERAAWAPSVAAVLCALVVALLRTEGLFFAVALGGASALAGLVWRRLGLVALGALVALAGPGAYLLDQLWASVIAGDPVDVDSFDRAQPSYLAGRFTSLFVTLLLPGYRGDSLTETLTLVGSALLVVGLVIVNRRPHDRSALLVPGVGALMLVVRAALQWGPVPGLLVAFPVGVGGLLLAERELLERPAVRVMLATSGVYALGVALTQYPLGGHTEWGGRYFALAVPLLGAVAAVAISRARERWAPDVERGVLMALGAGAVALAVLAVSTISGAHDRNRERSDGVLAAAASLPDPGDGGRPVVVTTDDQIPRLARGRFGEVRFLLVPADQLQPYLRRLATQGVEHLLLVALDQREALEGVPEHYEVVGPALPHMGQYRDEGALFRLRLTPRSG